MSTIFATNSYVKFIRGTPAAFATLTPKDNNTLYFISENGSLSGSLYLGEKLIGGGVGSVSLSELQDILIDTVGNNQVLAYNSLTNRWENTSVYNLISPMTGATASTSGATGLVPVPQAGDHLKFLRGDGSWTNLTSVSSGIFDSNVFEQKSNNAITLKGFLTATAGDILQKTSSGSVEWVAPETLYSELTSTVSNLQAVVNGLQGGIRRTIKNSIEEIDTSAADAEFFIYMIPNGNSIDGNIYDEYMVIDGVIEKIGVNLSGEITGYVTAEQVNTAINVLKNQISNDYVSKIVYAAEVGDLNNLLITQSNGDTIVDQLNDVTSRLTWYQLSAG